MLKRGRYCLMKFCSVSSASASVWTTSDSMWSISALIWLRELKWEATRLRIDFALPT
jgi:hypothetical protein